MIYTVLLASPYSHLELFKERISDTDAISVIIMFLYVVWSTQPNDKHLDRVVHIPIEIGGCGWHFTQLSTHSHLRYAATAARSHTTLQSPLLDRLTAQLHYSSATDTPAETDTGDDGGQAHPLPRPSRNGH